MPVKTAEDYVEAIAALIEKKRGLPRGRFSKTLWRESRDCDQDSASVEA